MRTARARLVETDISELQAQDEYNELYYGLAAESDSDLILHPADCSCRHVTSGGDYEQASSHGNIAEDNRDESVQYQGITNTFTHKATTDAPHSTPSHS